MPESISAPSTLDNEAARLLRGVSRQQKLLAVVHAPLLRAPSRRAPGLARTARTLPWIVILMALVPTAIAAYFPDQAVFLGCMLGLELIVILYLDVRRRQDALVALLEDSGTIGFPKTPTE